MSLRQLCNMAFAADMEGLDGAGREEYVRELLMPLDPMEQAKYIMGD